MDRLIVRRDAYFDSVFLMSLSAELTETDGLQVGQVVLGTPANIGYMSGALKHFFDQCYYPCLGATGNRPYALWVHGESDTAGAVRSVELVASALGWRRVHLPVSVVGAPQRSDLEAVRELAATVAATLALEMT